MLPDYARKAVVGTVSAIDITKDVYVVSPTSPVTTGAKAYVAPKAPKYINETVHILPYTQEALNLWDIEKWGRRKSKGTLDTADDVNNLLIGIGGKPFLSKVDLEKYNENDEYKYKNNYLYEVYHPSVFVNPAPNWFGGGSPSLYSTDAYAYRSLDPQKPEQLNFEKNNQVHTERLEIAAKAALMLYHTPDSENKKVITEWELDIDTCNFVKKMKKSTENLPTDLNKYRNASCYGLWGKWYNRYTGFHRGIDITFGAGKPIYSICEGFVVEYTNRDSLSYCVVRITAPARDAGKYLTYMHAQFNVKENTEIKLGEQIGVESNHMHGAKAFHTHIELNSVYPAPNEYLQAKLPKESIYSLSPYDFLVRCFEAFYDSIVSGKI